MYFSHLQAFAQSVPVPGALFPFYKVRWLHKANTSVTSTQCKITSVSSLPCLFMKPMLFIV